jgi:archaellum biogenesis protein FlaJ (TadC family)
MKGSSLNFLAASAALYQSLVLIANLIDVLVDGNAAGFSKVFWLCVALLMMVHSVTWMIIYSIPKKPAVLSPEYHTYMWASIANATVFSFIIVPICFVSMVDNEDTDTASITHGSRFREYVLIYSLISPIWLVTGFFSMKEMSSGWLRTIISKKKRT